MRDIWNEGKIEKRAEKEIMKRKGIKVVPQAVKKEYSDYLKVKEKSLNQLGKHHLDCLERNMLRRFLILLKEI